MVKVNQMKTARGGNVANHFITEIGDKIIMRSYDSVVCIINKFKHTVTFGKNYNYSVTAGKYLSCFLRENNFDNLGSSKLREAVIAKEEVEQSYTRTKYRIILDNRLV